MLASGLGSAGSATAQTKESAASQAGLGGGQVEERLPPVIYLRDKDGRLVPVINWKLTDLERLALVGRQGDRSQGPYRLTKSTAVGEVRDGHARLDLGVEIILGETRWVEVPLRLGEAILASEVKVPEGVQCSLEYRADESEYVAHVRGPVEKPIRIDFTILAPLRNSSGGSRLVLSGPPSAPAHLELRVPTPNPAVEVHGEAILDRTERALGAAVLHVLGRSADFDISWREGAPTANSTPLALEVEGLLAQRIAGRTVSVEAQLKVSSLGGEFDSFRVRLPAGARLIAEDQPNYVVRESSGSGESQPAVAEVTLTGGPTTGPVQVRLVTQRPQPVLGPMEWLELGGFDVEGAVRQTGHVAVEVDGDWQVIWGEQRQIQRVGALPTGLEVANLFAGFAYSGQPFSLPARVVPREAHKRVQPEYSVVVSSSRIRLTGQLKYRVVGAKAFTFAVNLEGWQLDAVGPENVVGIDQIAFNALTPLTIPLLKPATGEIDVWFEAHRDLPAGTDQIDFPLPQPVANSLAAASLIVFTDDNVELSPIADSIVGLGRRTDLPDRSTWRNSVPPLVYRSEAPQATFAATLRALERATSVQVTSELEVDADRTAVRQLFQFDVSREPLAELVLDVPRELALGGTAWQISMDGARLAPAGTTAAAAGTESLEVTVVLPQPRLGRFECAISYELPQSQARPLENGAQRRVPLVMPSMGICKSNVVVLRAGDGQRVKPNGNAWEQLEGEDPPHGANSFRAATFAGEILISVTPESGESLARTIIDRAWIQSVCSTTSCSQRAIYQLTTSDYALSVTTPAGALGVQILLDGSAATSREGSSSNERIVTWPRTEGSSRPRRLEVRFRAGSRGADPSLISLDAPRLASTIPVRAVYWELVLPATEFLFSSPFDAVGEFRWRWNGWYWARHPLLTEDELKQWIGGDEGPALPSTANRYLFSLGEAPTVLRARTAGRSWAVLAVSGVILAAGLLLIYAPVPWRAGLLFASGVALMAGGLYRPEATVLAAQAGLVGLVLVGVSLALERWVDSRREPANSRKAPSSIVYRGSTQTQPQAVSPGVPSSTQSAPAMASEPDA